MRLNLKISQGNQPKPDSSYSSLLVVFGEPTGLRCKIWPYILAFTLVTIFREVLRTQLIHRLMTQTSIPEYDTSMWTVWKA